MVSSSLQAQEQAELAGWAQGLERSALQKMLVAASRPGIISFALGIYSNLLSLGLSGWIRSRPLGLVTSIAAFISAFVVWTFVRWH